MLPGQGAELLNWVHLKSPDGSAVALVEKVVSNEGSELGLWRGTADAGLVLHTETYDVLEPLHQVAGGPVSVLYFPYLADLDRPRRVLRPEFRKNMHTIVSAVAEFNGRNLIGSDPHLADQPFTATRPTVAGLKVRLGVRSRTARTLQRSWDAAHDDWLQLREAYDELPRCLCHNDVAPWNVVCRDGRITTFADLGLSGTGPVGSDLDSVIRGPESTFTTPHTSTTCWPPTSKRSVRTSPRSASTTSGWRPGRRTSCDTQTCGSAAPGTCTPMSWQSGECASCDGRSGVPLIRALDEHRANGGFSMLVHAAPACSR
jgi:hypothetical protein